MHLLQAHLCVCLPLTAWWQKRSSIKAVRARSMQRACSSGQTYRTQRVCTGSSALKQKATAAGVAAAGAVGAVLPHSSSSSSSQGYLQAWFPCWVVSGLVLLQLGE
jgi:hypothetical protein